MKATWKLSTTQSIQLKDFQGQHSSHVRQGLEHWEQFQQFQPQ